MGLLKTNDSDMKSTEISSEISRQKMSRDLLINSLKSELEARCHDLSAAERKKFIRDVQFELPSAWKFYMGLATNKQVLFLLDSFTTLPLSVARNSDHVVIYGLNEAEVELLRQFAAAKKISNYTCTNELNTLATQFDIIVSLHDTLKQADTAFLKEISQFVHEETELWLTATNEYSLKFAKGLVTGLTNRQTGTGAGGSDKKNGTSEAVWRFNGTPRMISRKAVQVLSQLECKPYTAIGISPASDHIKSVVPLKKWGDVPGNGTMPSFWQQFTVGEIAIGARRTRVGKSLLARLLSSVPDTDLNDGRLLRYFVSGGGKVLLFVEFDKGGSSERVLIKLPLNDYTSVKVLRNYDFLLQLREAEQMAGARQELFPRALGTGEFEGQPFYIESLLNGRSGDAFQIPRNQREDLLHETFSIWLGIQQSFARTFYFDEEKFYQTVEIPIRRMFHFVGKDDELSGEMQQLLTYLRKQFVHKDVTLSLIHGDFSLKNIMFNEYALRFKGIIDWDMARTDFFPIIDVFHFFTRLQRIPVNKSAVMVLQGILQARKSNRYFQQVWKMYKDTFGLEESCLTAMSIMYWMHLLSGHHGSLKLILDKTFIKRNFLNPLNMFLKKID